MKIGFKFDQKKLNEFVRRCTKTGKNALVVLTHLVEGRAVKLAPYRTGNLYRGVVSRIFGNRGVVKSTAEYSVFVHEGTGLYGKYAHPIVPVNKQALYWEGADHPYRSVKGQKPNPFLQNAVEEVANEVLK